jgi:hypothetical protein
MNYEPERKRVHDFCEREAQKKLIRKILSILGGILFATALCALTALISTGGQ